MDSNCSFQHESMMCTSVKDTSYIHLYISLRALSSGQCVLPRSDIRLLSPVTGPEKVVCVGMNYKDHCLEQNAPIPKEPIIFSKFPSTITGPYDDIILPEDSTVSYETKYSFIWISGLTLT